MTININKVIVAIVAIVLIIISYFGYAPDIEKRGGGARSGIDFSKIKSRRKIKFERNVVLPFYETFPEYFDYIDCPPLKETLDIMEKGCHADDINSILRDDNIAGFPAKILPAGSKLYKAINGFPTEKMITDYSAANPDLPSWWADKYYPSYLAVSYWGTMVVYELVKDMVFVDYHNGQSLKKIKEMIMADVTIDDNSREALLEILQISTGFEITVEKQITTIINFPNLGFKNYIHYDRPIQIAPTYQSCNTYSIDGLNPTGVFPNEKSNIDAYLVTRLERLGFDGHFKKQCKSTIDMQGIYLHEELVIKNSSILTKMKMDTENPHYWKNYSKLELDIPATGLLLSNSFTHLGSLRSNHKFALVRFLLDNRNIIEPVPKKSPRVLSFNVHFFKSLDLFVKTPETIQTIQEFINIMDPDIICFQEYIKSDAFENFLKDSGFKIITAENGGDQLLVLMALKIPHWDVKIIDTECHYTPRNQIMVGTKYGKIVNLHLEIGKRERYEHKVSDKERNIITRKFNSNIRSGQLKKILERDPDILIGDFNATSDSDELGYLESNGYNRYDNNSINTTPYNRVDFVLSRKPLGEQHIIKTNISDHLPVIQDLE